MFAYQKSSYQSSLQFIQKVFNSLVNCIALHVKNFPGQSKRLSQLLPIWTHQKGMSNLLRTICLHYQSDLRIVTRPPQMSFSKKIVSQSEKIPMSIELNKSRKSLSSSRKRKVKNVQVNLQQVYDKQAMNEELLEDGDIEEDDLSDFVDDDGKLYKRGPYKSYSMEEKLKAVEMFLVDKKTITQISRTLNIPCKNIKRWSTEGIHRKRGGGRRKTNPFLEEEVHRWIKFYFKQGDLVLLDQISNYALSRSQDPLFKASRGWATKFAERFNLKQSYQIA